MQAIAVRADSSTPSVIEVDRPTPAPGEALVRVLRVGVDGTDHEVLAGGHGGLPADDDYLILGHEAVGVVVEPADRFDAGDPVVPMVRRPPASGPNEYVRRDEPDMAPIDACLECGIDGAHGYMAEYVTVPEQYLVGLPDCPPARGVLVEPASVVEKAIDAARASREYFDWQPESALVLGNGALGLLTVAMLRDHPSLDLDRLYCLGRRDRPDPTIDLIEQLGATYVDSRRTPVADVAAAHEPVDLVVEATGVPRHALDAVHALATNGVAALLGVPDDATCTLDAGASHRRFVLGNRALVGTVNARRRHFEAARGSVAALPDAFVDAFVTGVYGLDAFERAFDDGDDVIKTAVEFAPPGAVLG